MAGLKVYFWLWEHLCHQVEISRRTAKILGAQLKMLGAQLKILVAPKRKIRKLQTLAQYSFISMLSFISILCLFLSRGGGGGVLPSNRLMGMCRWMGPHFHDWIDYNGVVFLIGANRVTRNGVAQLRDFRGM